MMPRARRFTLYEWTDVALSAVMHCAMALVFWWGIIRFAHYVAEVVVL